MKSLAVITRDVTDEAGNLLDGAQVIIRVGHDSGGALAMIYADGSGETAITSPVTLDGISEGSPAPGQLQVYVEPGLYRLDGTGVAGVGFSLVDTRGDKDPETTRAIMVERISGGFVPNEGQTYLLDGLAYLGKPSATAIPDLFGLLPAGVLAPEHFGAVGDGVVDDSNALELAGNYGRAKLSSKVYAVSSPVHLNNSGCGLIGNGGSFMSNVPPFDQEAKTTILAKADFVGLSVIRIAPLLSDTFVSHEQYLDGINVNADENAQWCIDVVSTRATRIRGTSAFYGTSGGLRLRVFLESEWSKTTKSNKATKHFEVDGFLTRVTGTADGIRIEGCDDVINTNFGYMSNVYSQHEDGDGIALYDSDGCMFTNIVTWRSSGDTGGGMVFYGSDSPSLGSARGHYVFGLQCTQGGLQFKSGTVQNALSNDVRAYSLGNASPVPTFDVGCKNTVSTTSGPEDVPYWVTDTQTAKLRLWRTDPVTSPGVIVGSLDTYAKNPAGSEKTWARMRSRVTVSTSGAEVAQWDLETISGGTLARRGILGLGFAMGSGLSSDPGDGVVQAETRFRIGNVGNISWFSGTGSPDGVLAASVGSFYSRSDGGSGTTLYVKETGGATSSGWVAK